METARLLVELTDPDEGTRASALEELADRMDDEIAKALLDIAASDAADDARADVIVFLGPLIDECGIDYDDDELEIDFGPEMGPPVARETFASIVAGIAGLYSDEAQPKLIRRRAFEVLIRDPRPWHSTEVRKHFASADPEWRLTAVFAMGFITGFAREIVATLQTAEGPLLAEAVRAAGKMEVSGAASRARELAASSHEDLALRLAAIDALPHVDRHCSQLLDQLARSRNADIAEAAEEALLELSMEEAGDLI